MGWHETLAVNAKGLVGPKGEMGVRGEKPLNATNPHYLRVRAYEPGYSLYNTGFRGTGVQSGAEYRFPAYVRSIGPKSIRATVTDAAAKVLASGKLEGFTGQWQRYETVLRAEATDDHAQLNLILDDKGELDLDMVSLFPVDTWKGPPNGLRKDLVQLLYDMHPGFIRFPGGCIVEGRQLLTRYRWKTTVGDIAKRQTIINRWNYEFDQRPAPDYFQLFGLGFYEYFQLAEDIGARPLPILNCGMACQFNSGETAHMEDLHEYIQDTRRGGSMGLCGAHGLRGEIRGSRSSQKGSIRRPWDARRRACATQERLMDERTLPNAAEDFLELCDVLLPKLGSPLAFDLAEHVQGLCPRGVSAFCEADNARAALLRRIRPNQVPAILEGAEQPVHRLLAHPGALRENPWALPVRAGIPQQGHVRQAELFEARGIQFAEDAALNGLRRNAHQRADEHMLGFGC